MSEADIEAARQRHDAEEEIAKRLRESGAVPDAASNVTRPPADYIPPTRD